jgi:acetyltransferase-like isoleucine patch superfamily enzyme
MFNKIINKLYAILQRSSPARLSWEVYKDYVKIHPSVIIDPAASIKIFNPPNPPQICLEIGEGSHIFSTFSLLRSQAKITIGKRCQLGVSQFIAADAINIEDDVIMAWGCTLIDSDNHSLYWDERQYDVERCRKDYVKTNCMDIARSHDWSKVNIEKISIKSKTWIGFNSIILKGVTIGEGSVVGAGSVVTADVDPWHVGAGNPFKHIKKVSLHRQ